MDICEVTSLGHGVIHAKISKVGQPHLYSRWGGSVSRCLENSLSIVLDGVEHNLNDVHWFFEILGYSPTTWWHYWGRLVLAFSEAALKGGMMSVSVVLESDGGMAGALDAFVESITGTIASSQKLSVVRELESPSELIAGVVLTLLGKAVLGCACAYATGGGPWLVIWLSTALSRWTARDIGSMRRGGNCGAAGVHIHAGHECRIRLLDTTCLSSAGSEHSRVLEVFMALVGWIIARVVYNYYPEAQGFLVVQEWECTTGFVVGSMLLIMVCAIGLLTMRYTLPKHPLQRYFFWRMIIEWVLAILAIASVFSPVMILRTTKSRWMISAEIAAWIIDLVTTVFVIGTYPDCISPWHSVWVLVPALLSALGGLFGCWQ
jgi:hypothetical protein